MHAQLRPTTERPPQVEHVGAGNGLGDRDRLDRLDHLDRIALLSDHPAGRRGQLRGRQPVAPVVTRRRPARSREPGVVGLARVGRIRLRRALHAPPPRIGHHCVTGTVRVLDLQLGEQPRLAVPGRGGPVPRGRDPLAEEAPAQLGPDDILSFVEHGRHVVRHGQDAFVVVGGRGVEHVVADLEPVELQLVVADPDHVQPCSTDVLAHRELAAQQRRGCHHLRLGDSAPPGASAVADDLLGLCPGAVVERRVLPTVPHPVAHPELAVAVQDGRWTRFVFDGEAGDEPGRGRGRVGGRYRQDVATRSE